MPEATIMIDAHTGRITVEGLDEAELRDMLGEAEQVNCGKPVHGVVALPSIQFAPGGAPIAVHRLYHGSVVDGPGRRSVLQVQGCPIRCKGCYVPQTHATAGGTPMSTGQAFDALLAGDGGPCDGVTLLGGEPFAQADALAPLATALEARGIDLTIYTGYRVEWLARRSDADRVLLSCATRVIDGPYVAHLGTGAGEWRGSTNQRILERAALDDVLQEACA